jgi:hypothetical protein
MSKNPSVVVVPIGDLHVGSSVALCPKDGVRLEDGGMYFPNQSQKWLHEKWTILVDAVRDLKRKRKHIIVIFLGEFIDGRHHETTQLLAQSPEIQATAAIETFLPISTLANELYVMRGTEAHSGKGAAADFSIGRELGAIRDPDTGQAAWYKLKLDVLGTLFDVAHHVSAGGDDVRTYGSAIRREMAAMLMERPSTNIVLRGHVHKYSDTGDAFGADKWGAVIPAWQLQTAFVHRITRRESAMVGTSLLHVESDGWFRKSLFWKVPEPKPMISKANLT